MTKLQCFKVGANLNSKIVRCHSARSDGISAQHSHFQQLRFARNLQLIHDVFINDISVAAGIEECVDVSKSICSDIPYPYGDDRANYLVVGYGSVG